MPVRESAVAALCGSSSWAALFVELSGGGDTNPAKGLAFSLGDGALSGGRGMRPARGFSVGWPSSCGGMADKSTTNLSSSNFRFGMWDIFVTVVVEVVVVVVVVVALKGLVALILLLLSDNDERERERQRGVCCRGC
jgi:hypothetical protein